MTNILGLFLMTAALGQPPSWRSGVSEDDLKELGSYVKLEVLGLLSVKAPIDPDPKTLTDYSREGSAFVNGNFQQFELFLGEDQKLPALAKELNGKFVIVRGDMVVLHAPGVLLEYGGEYHHFNPRYLIKVRHLELAAEQPKEISKQINYVKVEVKGMLRSDGFNVQRDDGKNGTLDDAVNRRASLGTSVYCNPCSRIRLYLGEKDKWLDRAKKLDRELVLVRGDLHYVPRADRPTPTNAWISPFSYVTVTSLAAADPPNDKSRDKKVGTKPKE